MKYLLTHEFSERKELESVYFESSSSEKELIKYIQYIQYQSDLIYPNSGLEISEHSFLNLIQKYFVDIEYLDKKQKEKENYIEIDMFKCWETLKTKKNNNMIEGKDYKIFLNELTQLLDYQRSVYYTISDLIDDNKKMKKEKNSVKFQDLVKEFHVAFNHPVSNVPKALANERIVNRSVWTAEEIIELLHAASSSVEEFHESYDKLKKGLKDAFYKSLLEEFPKTNLEKTVSQADALTDQLYFIFGTCVELGVDISKVFEIVQAANMSKLFTDENGNKYAKYREDGKILKSPEFFAPEELISFEIARQMTIKK